MQEIAAYRIRYRLFPVEKRRGHRLVLFGILCFFMCASAATAVAQVSTTDSLAQQMGMATTDSATTSLLVDRKERFRPYLDPVFGVRLRNDQGTFARKMIRGGLLVHGFEAIGYSLLTLMPQSFSGWDKNIFGNYGVNLKRAYSAPPVFDKDQWYINYIGHPYQGTFFYNSVRSQNAKIWQSALFTIGQVYVWEYIIEAGLEQPSIQDLIVTPLAGIGLGELIHFGTMRMARHGFTWYEAVVVTIINPSFIMNNGYHFGMHARKRRAAKALH